MNGLTLAPAGANVVMQLARLPVGHAVAESRVDSGALAKHPIKRTRTTVGYLLLCLFGSEEERRYLRREVNRQHREVHSLPGDAVAYDAFDPELQLWVAACLYRGALDALTWLYGPPPRDTLDELYRHAARFATTLQVPETAWPADRVAFEEYWEESLQLIEMDATTRAYLEGLVSLRFLPRPLSSLLGPAHRFFTTGFLPEPFRRELGLAWSARRQHAFEVASRVAISLHDALPRGAREFPLNVLWWDARRRAASGRDFV